MYREYDRSLNFSDYVVQGAHGRTGAFAITQNQETAIEKFHDGWTYENNGIGIWLRAPDVSLVDITEPFRVKDLGDPAINLAKFRMLTELQNSGDLEEFIGFVKNSSYKTETLEFYVSQGEVLEGEFRMGGSDYRVHDLKREVVDNMQKLPRWKNILNQSKEFLGLTRKIKATTMTPDQFDYPTQCFLDQVNYMNRDHYPCAPKLGMDVLPGLIDQLPAFDRMIFIPTGCNRYMSSFLRSDTIEKIMFWEIHTDPNQIGAKRLLQKQIENQRCLIIDKSYTGNTLTRMAELVREVGGQPIRLALFPKNRVAVKKSEALVFLDQVMATNQVEMTDTHWAENLYKSVLTTSTEKE